ncbi:MAG: regulatory protein RecX [Eubacteriales bacterium]|nr:regulatory protein RecX [Eubacteriales bacterium]
MPLTPEEQKKARRKAMQLLEHMDRTEKGLSDRLRQAGFTWEAAADALEYVKGYGYVDDLRYARAYLLSRQQSKSKARLFQELHRKGVDQETICQAWEEAGQIAETDERELLRRMIRKKCEPGTELDEKSYRRLWGAMVRQGFEMGDISAVLEEMDIFYRPSWRDGD